MSLVFCSGTGSNTAPYNTWATAATTFAAAVTQASSAGDVIVVDAANPPAGAAASLVVTLTAGISIIASTNSGTATITPTSMGGSAWVGPNAGYGIQLNCSGKVYLYGITFKVSGTSATIYVNYNGSGHFEFDNCLIWNAATGGSSYIIFGQSNGGASYAQLKNSQLGFGSASTALRFAGQLDLVGGGIYSGGSIPSTLFNGQGGTALLTANGFDLSGMGTNTLVGNFTTSTATLRFTQCPLSSGLVILGSQSLGSKSAAKVYLSDCSVGSVQGLFGYYDALGSVVSDTGTYLTAGAAGQSWKVTTTAYCTFGTPFVTPWVDQWNSTLTAITPAMEILRTDSTSAYTNQDMWGEFTAKVTTGTTDSTFYSSRQALVDYLAGTAGAALAAGVGTGSWTGAGATPWSGKVDSGSSITPAYAGYLRARLAVAVPSATIYLNPQAA